MTSEAQHTYLYESHIKSGGKMMPFSGYQLPVRYSSIKDEHLSVRQNVGMFDISHMGVLHVSGASAFDFLQTIITNDINKALNQKMVYGMILNDKGGILDDVMVGCIKENDFMLVVNAANKKKILDWLKPLKPEDLSIEDMEIDHGFMAVQGPNASVVLTEVLEQDFSSHKRFSVFEAVILGKKTLVARTGYTGEDGFELLLHKSIINTIWDKLERAGVTPCGLGARDTLRLEFGLPLYGQELNENITPLMTRYPWVLAWDTNFIGKEALLRLKEQPKEYTTVGLKMKERVIPRTGYPILEGGYVTSGTLSPLLDIPIAMALVKSEYSELGSEVTVSIRNKDFVGEVVKVPFISK